MDHRLFRVGQYESTTDKVCSETAINHGNHGSLKVLFGHAAFFLRTLKYTMNTNSKASLGFLVLGLLLLKIWVPESLQAKKNAIFASALWGGLFLNAPIPLFYEMAVSV